MERLLALLPLLGWWAGSAVAAEPVVVPEFSYDDNANFALSVMLQNQVADRLVQEGHLVLGQGVVARQVGDAAVQRCFENPACPGSILPQLPAKIALVVRVYRGPTGLMGRVEVWEQGRPGPVQVQDLPIRPGEEPQFVDAVVRVVNGVIYTLPPSDDATLMAASRLITGQPVGAFTPSPYPPPGAPPAYGQPAAPPYGPSTPPAGAPYGQPVYGQPAAPAPGAPVYGQPTPGASVYGQPAAPTPGAPIYGQPAPGVYGQHPVAPGQPAAPGVPVYGQPATPPVYGSPVAPEPSPPPLEDLDAEPASKDEQLGRLAQRLEGTGVRPHHLAGVKTRFAASDLDPREWLYTRTPHGGRVVVEARFGMGFGDVHRRAELMVEVDGMVQTENAISVEAPMAGRGVRAGGFLGYAPNAFVDVGLLVGMQYGTRAMRSGSVSVESGVSDINSWDHENSQPVAAAQLVVQPRARLFLLPTGIVKPFLVGGPSFRIFDRYKTFESTTKWPLPPGAIVPGVVGGGGLVVDPSPLYGIFVEATYVRHLGVRSRLAQKVVCEVDPCPSERWPYPGLPPVSEELRSYERSTISAEIGVQFRL